MRSRCDCPDRVGVVFVGATRVAIAASFPRQRPSQSDDPIAACAAPTGPGSRRGGLRGSDASRDRPGRRVPRQDPPRARGREFAALRWCPSSGYCIGAGRGIADKGALQGRQESGYKIRRRATSASTARIWAASHTPSVNSATTWHAPCRGFIDAACAALDFHPLQEVRP